MARPKNKEELLNLSGLNFEKLLNQIKSVREKHGDVIFPEAYLNRNIRDVLAHLHEWHNMMLRWHEDGMNGIKPDMPKKGFTWRTIPQLNREIWESCQDQEYEEVLENLKRSHEKITSLITGHTNEELFTKKKYKWTGSTSLGAYLVSSTSSHYDWAYKLIKKCIK